MAGTGAIVPDNLKAAVRKASRYEAELNEDYAAFAEITVAQSYRHACAKPRDKALVEAPSSSSTAASTLGATAHSS